jgi:hypothetical protein
MGPLRSPMRSIAQLVALLFLALQPHAANAAAPTPPPSEALNVTQQGAALLADLQASVDAWMMLT